MKEPNEILQNLPYFWKMKTLVFQFPICATLIFPLVHVDIHHALVENIK